MRKEEIKQERAVLGYCIAPITWESHRVLADHRQKKILVAPNSYVFCRFHALDLDGQEKEIEILGQIVGGSIENPYQSPLEQGILSRFGQEIEKGQGDLLIYEVKPVAAMDLDSGLPAPIGIPPSRTPYYLIRDEKELDAYIEEPAALAYFGHLSGTQIDAGLVIKHFGGGGWGDARLIGVAGQSGSGKSVLISQLLAAHTRHPELGALVLDPQGQYSSCDAQGNYCGEIGKDPTRWSWSLARAFRQFGRLQDVMVARTSKIALDPNPATFCELLRHFRFWDVLRSGISGEKKNQAEYRLVQILTAQNLAGLEFKPLWPQIKETIALAYRNPDAEREILEALPPQTLGEAEKIWNINRLYFNNLKRPITLDNLIKAALIERKIVILSNDLRSDFVGNLYLFQLLSHLHNSAQKMYSQSVGQGQKSPANCLVVVDEAQNLIPEHPQNEAERERVDLVRSCINVSRKLGVGWLFATQSVANIDRGIWGQLGTKFIGYGFGVGPDKERLLEIMSRDSQLLRRYCQRPNPLATNRYWFFAQGELLPLGDHIFFDCYPSQDAWLQANI